MNMKRILSITSLLLLLTVNLFAATETYQSGMVVSAHPRASQFGVEILQHGGNAVDAAVGTALIVSVVEPFGSGFGGGGGMLIYLSEPDSLTFINYYANAPQQLPDDIDHYGPSTILVPGTVAGLYYALRQYGTISWKQLLTQVIEKVRDGISVDAYLFKLILDSYDKLYPDPQSRSIYLTNDLPPDPGTVIKNDRLVKTLKLLAEQGPDIFYHGQIADSIIACIEKYGGTVRKQDLENYQIQEVRPLQGSYRGHTIVSAPPPMSGASVIEILNILEFSQLSPQRNYVQDPITLQLFIDAVITGYRDRLHFLCDPNFHEIKLDRLLSKSFAKDRFRSIHENIQLPENEQNATSAKDENGKNGSTTHISVTDAMGNAVSLTQTLNRFWGSGISVCGFLLNNGMTSFYVGDTLNQPQPGKQPRTTISPSLVFRGDSLRMVIGTPGGGRIISTMVQVLSQIIDYNQKADTAIRAPRFALKRNGRKIPVEAGFYTDAIAQLKAAGYSLELRDGIDLYFGGVQLILIDTKTGALHGASDPRRSGTVAGY